MGKICSQCKLNKSTSEFYKNNRSRDKIDFICKQCRYNREKIYRKSIRGRTLKREKDKRYSQTKHGKLARRKANKAYRQKEHIKRWHSERQKAINKNYKTILLNTQKKCQLCESTTQLQIDHIIPISSGGKSILSNLWILCHDCNQSKRNHTLLADKCTLMLKAGD